MRSHVGALPAPSALIPHGIPPGRPDCPVHARQFVLAAPVRRHPACLSLPRLSLPRLSPPRLSPPRLSLPRLSPPRLSPPAAPQAGTAAPYRPSGNKPSGPIIRKGTDSSRIPVFTCTAKCRCGPLEKPVLPA